MDLDGDIEKTRKCIRCGKIKPITDFVFEKRSGNYVHYCLECDKEYHRKYYKERKEQNANKIIKIDPGETKACIRCGLKKSLFDFSFDKANGKFINTCKSCKAKLTQEYYKKNTDERKEYAKAYVEQNREKVRAKRKEYYNSHSEHARAYSRQYEKDHWDEVRAKRKEYRKSHKEEFRERDKQYYEAHKEQIKERYIQWAKEHSEQLAAYNKKYREKNADSIKMKRQAYDKKNRHKITRYYINKRNTDPLFKLSTQVRGLIRASLKRRGYKKDTNTYEILGCDYNTLWEHLKQTWLGNYGREWNGEPYHIDHIIPLATANSEQEIKDLCYYKNLQLLKPQDNLAKNKLLNWNLKK